MAHNHHPYSLVSLFFATAARSGLGEFAVLYTSASFMRNPTHVFFT
jgi:hypothetical protein